MRRGMAVLLVVGWLSLAVAASARAQAPATPPTLAATGTGHVLATPDQATLYITVVRVRATSAAARAATNRQLARIRRTLRANRVPRNSVHPTVVSVSRERLRRHGGRTRTRYRAYAELDIVTRDVPHLGALFDALADAGADDVSGPDFSFSDPSAERIVATRRALADARRRADDAAAQLGLQVTGIASVDLDPQSGASEESAGGSGSSSGSTRLEPGREDVAASVRVVYELAPR